MEEYDPGFDGVTEMGSQAEIWDVIVVAFDDETPESGEAPSPEGLEASALTSEKEESPHCRVDSDGTPRCGLDRSDGGEHQS